MNSVMVPRRHRGGSVPIERASIEHELGNGVEADDYEGEGIGQPDTEAGQQVTDGIGHTPKRRRCLAGCTEGSFSPKGPARRPMAYADNFSFNRREAWTH